MYDGDYELTRLSEAGPLLHAFFLEDMNFANRRWCLASDLFLFPPLGLVFFLPQE